MDARDADAAAPQPDTPVSFPSGESQRDSSGAQRRGLLARAPDAPSVRDVADGVIRAYPGKQRATLIGLVLDNMGRAPNDPLAAAAGYWIDRLRPHIRRNQRFAQMSDRELARQSAIASKTHARYLAKREKRDAWGQHAFAAIQDVYEPVASAAPVEPPASVALPDGWAVERCDHKGNCSAFGVYWVAIGGAQRGEPEPYYDWAAKAAWALAAEVQP